MIRCLLAILLLATLAAPSMAQSRRALVIGIDDYRNVAKLQKAVGDAQAMKAALEKLGFAVDLLADPDRREFSTGLSAFTAKLKPDDVALIHFSGHGVTLDGENFLLPVDVPRPGSADKDLIKSESFGLTSVIERVRGSGARTVLLVVDACRDNPYATAGTRSVGAQAGLANVAPPRGPGGVFVMYSAGYGQTAADRLDDNDREPTSVYTRTLLRKIAVEGKPITDLAREVREDVEALAATVKHQQRPAYYDELSGPPFFFSPPKAGATNAADARGLELAFWDSIKQSPSPALLQEYLDRFGANATFASIARERLRDLQTLQPAAQPVAVPVTSPPVQAAALRFQPSFDCEANTNALEKLICGDAGLAARDRLLSETYYRLADSIGPNERLALRDAQRLWLRERNVCGTNAICLAQAYDKRLAQLQGSAPQVAAVTPPPQRSVAATPVAPGFACSGPLTAVERMICDDPALAERDNRLNALFREARTRPGVTEAQRGWMKLRNACTDVACIARAYDRRIGELRSLPR